MSLVYFLFNVCFKFVKIDLVAVHGWIQLILKSLCDAGPDFTQYLSHFSDM